jgi:hypothetical protein
MEKLSYSDFPWQPEDEPVNFVLIPGFILPVEEASKVS